VQLLRKEYGTNGVIFTVVEAVKREADRLRAAGVQAEETTAEDLAANI
jgi:hypothetical protein